MRLLSGICTALVAFMGMTSWPPEAQASAITGDCYAGGISSALGQAGCYNLFVAGTANASNSNVTGRIAVVNDAKFNNYSAGFGNGVQDGTILSKNPARNDVVVGGNLSWTNGSVANGSVAVGGSADIEYANIGGTANSGGTMTWKPGQIGSSPNGNVANTIKTDLMNQDQFLVNASAYWNSLPTTPYDYVISQYGTLTFHGNGADFNVFNITANQLANASSHAFNGMGSNATILINVTGGNGVFSGGFDLGGADPAHVIWNFDQAPQITISGAGVPGTILAPSATLTANSTGHIDGNLIINNFYGGVELHNFGFLGTLPNPVIGLDGTEAPEPAGTGLLGGLLMAGATLVRRSRR